MIYFIGNEHGAIKIGYTADLDIWPRLGHLQSTNADLLTPLGYKGGALADEGSLHARFAHLKIRGEWFIAADELLNYIFSLPGADKEKIQGWVAATLPRGDTASLQRLMGAIYANVLSGANEQARSIIGVAKKQARSIVRVAHVKAGHIISKAERKHKRVVDFAIDCAVCDIRELIAGSCELPLLGCHCCKCGRMRHTVREREDGLPWCNPCWVNHAIFDSGRFDATMAQIKDTSVGMGKD